MKKGIVLFRRDLRLIDNPAFIQACNQCDTILPIYIDDPEYFIGEAQKWWLTQSLKNLDISLHKHHLSLAFRKGDRSQILSDLILRNAITDVYWNDLYEPKVMNSDANLKPALESLGIKVHTYNASLLIKPDTIPKMQVFSHFWRKCLSQMPHHDEYKLNKTPSIITTESDEMPVCNALWEEKLSKHWIATEDRANQIFDDFIKNAVQNYKIDRDLPSKEGTSLLSVYLHFGQISVARMYNALQFLLRNGACNEVSVNCFISELGWREFAYHLIHYMPDMDHINIKSKFDALPWMNNEKMLDAWKKGMTGYPIIDAGMRQLWETGFMHNRVRMITASFLIKNLLVDWRIGAQWFEETLLDADLAVNRMNWQWVAGTGVDAAPYFRIFNPMLQSAKFDENAMYIKRWIPELSNLHKDEAHDPSPISRQLSIRGSITYPNKIIDFPASRNRYLELAKKL